MCTVAYIVRNKIKVVAVSTNLMRITRSITRVKNHNRFIVVLEFKADSTQLMFTVVTDPFSVPRSILVIDTARRPASEHYFNILTQQSGLCEGGRDR